jgi:hypothetical protein
MGVAVRASTYFLKFGFMLVIMTVACAFAWELLVDNRLYNSTDTGVFDYLRPGDWVHAHDGLPIKVVSHIADDNDTSHPDTIREGWSVQGLWTIWFGFFGVSLIVSTLVARLNWVPRRWREL